MLSKNEHKPEQQRLKAEAIEDKGTEEGTWLGVNSEK